MLIPLPALPSMAALTRIVAPVLRSCTNTSGMSLVSRAARLLAKDTNTIQRPSADMQGWLLVSLACVPSDARLTSSVVCVWRSCTNTSATWFVSPSTRLSALEENTTCLPSAEIQGELLWSLPCAPGW